ncbi:MAG: anhydro-N-acetylmuramic acid kinase [Bacteroidota bacterium]
MVYRAIGLMSGSSLDGLDIAFVEFHENAGQWTFQVLQADCYEYDQQWITKLQQAPSLSALDYQLLHTDYGHYLGKQVNHFIEKNDLHYQVALITSHGHTTFHLPSKKMTAQLGDGAAIAAETKLPVVTDLRSLDIAFGGQGAPIVPIGEKLLWNEYDYFLNLGGIANISMNTESLSGSGYIAFDVCPANKVLNMLAQQTGKEFDEEGKLAAGGTVNTDLLEKLNALDYYKLSYPKSLNNEFGTEVVYPLMQDAVPIAIGSGIRDALRTYVEHITAQLVWSIKSMLRSSGNNTPLGDGGKLLVTGGGAFNTFLMQRLKTSLEELKIEIIVPDDQLVKFKEAIIMALIGVLRWRQEYNVLSSVTGAQRNSIGGALWTGEEA